MSWLLDYKKYKKKLKELLYYRSELDYQNDILADAHQAFEEYYLQYCAENNIDLQALNEANRNRVDQTLEKSEAATNALIHKPVEKAQDKTKVFNSIYREIAKKIHPDKLSIFLPKEELDQKESMFKQASSAMDKADWAKLLEIADKLDVRPNKFEGMVAEMDKEINKIKLIIQNNESMFSWVWQKQDNDASRDEVVRNFLFQLFGFRN